MRRTKPKTKKSFLDVLRKYSLPRIIAGHLFGKDHHTGHRLFTGLIVMISGVLLAKSVHGGMLHYITDLFGYLLHGAGATPYVEYFAANGSVKSPQNTEE